MLRLEAQLGISRYELKRAAANAGKYYQPFPKPEKIRPFQRIFKVKKTRWIDNPTGELKNIQKRIYEKLLKPISLPSNVMGGVGGRTITQNASLHIGCRTLVKVDIRSFFPSVSNAHVYRVWTGSVGCSPEIASLLTKLTTFERRLPQGAPTSTAIANLLILSIDGNIRTECARLGVQYSPWVDDLAFSGDDPRPLVGIAIRELARAGLSVSRRKIRVTGPKDEKTLTGVRLGARPHPERRQEQWVRAGIHKIKLGLIPAPEMPKYLRELDGRIAHISSINPQAAERFKKQLRTSLSQATE